MRLGTKTMRRMVLPSSAAATFGSASAAFSASACAASRGSAMVARSLPITCTATVNKNVTNHMKLAIADVGDEALDSNVFIEAGSIVVVNDPPVVDAAFHSFDLVPDAPTPDDEFDGYHAQKCRGIKIKPDFDKDLITYKLPNRCSNFLDGRDGIDTLVYGDAASGMVTGPARAPRDSPPARGRRARAAGRSRRRRSDPQRAHATPRGGAAAPAAGGRAQAVPAGPRQPARALHRCIDLVDELIDILF